MKLKKGDEMAFAHLMELFHNRLCIYSYNLCKDYDEAKDIVQNVFLNLWERREYIEEISSLKNFLYKSVYNNFINHYRKNNKFKIFEKEHIKALSEINETDNDDIIVKQINFIKAEIDNLPKKCRNVFLLSKNEGLTNVEIAEYLDISVKTVEKHITRAFSVLKKKLFQNEKLFFILLLSKKLLSKIKPNKPKIIVEI
ncbi:RNA polymerase sigma factor [Winogradskyella bathintestinalis]|nr:RNA polymerase sigma-70 factor [Winogradskyella bathintestinalis]